MKTNGLYEEVIIAGFGGQGIISAGRLLAQTAMTAGKEVTCMFSYGAEVRGGTSNCMLVVADESIASPLVSKPDSLIVMSSASLSKFASWLKDGGLLVYNSSLIDEEPQVSEGTEVLAVPADDIAIELGDPKVANMVALGAYLQKRGILSIDTAAESLPSVLAKRYHISLPVNIAALQKGAEFVQNNK